MTAFATILVLAALAYIAGSVPTGYWVGKVAAGIDVREHGSKSTGATNVLRTVGKIPGLITLVVDIGKGYLPVWIAVYLEQLTPRVIPADPYQVIPPIIALLTVIGHSKSVFLGFSGGKSAATGLGTLLALAPMAAGSIFALWLLLVVATKIVSIASIAAGIATPIFMFVFHAPPSYVGYGLLAGAFVVFRHKTNIARLIAGTETRFDQKPE